MNGGTVFEDNFFVNYGFQLLSFKFSAQEK